MALMSGNIQVTIGETKTLMGREKISWEGSAPIMEKPVY